MVFFPVTGSIVIFSPEAEVSPKLCCSCDREGGAPEGRIEEGSFKSSSWSSGPWLPVLGKRGRGRSVSSLNSSSSTSWMTAAFRDIMWCVTLWRDEMRSSFTMWVSYRLSDSIYKLYSSLAATPCSAVVAVSSMGNPESDMMTLIQRNGKGDLICEPFGSCERCPEEEVCVVWAYDATFLLTMYPDKQAVLPAFRQPSLVTLSRPRFSGRGRNASVGFVRTHNSAREGRLLRVYGKIRRISAFILLSF